MKRNITENSEHNQTRSRLQPENSADVPGQKSLSARKESMRSIGAAVDGLLRYSGFYERGRQNCSDYRLELNDIYLPNLPVAFEGYTILHLSDLHTDGLVDGGAGIMRVVESVPCDLAVMTGDFIFDDDSDNCQACLDVLGPIVRSISARDGLFGVLGNHDFFEMVPDLERMGVRMLLNEAVQLRRGTAKIVLAGVDDPHFYKCHDIQHALATVAENQFVMMMSHSPEIAMEASRYGVDLFLCGHTHGGQICLPGRLPLYVHMAVNRCYASGSWKCGDMYGYTSRGTGFSLSAARFFCPPEITLHTLHSGNLPYELNTAAEKSSHGWFGTVGHAIYA